MGRRPDVQSRAPRSARRFQAISSVFLSASLWASLGLFGGVRGVGNAPRVVFFLGVGNPFQRGLVGLVVCLLLFLDLFLIHLLVVAALRTLAANLCLSRCRDPRKHGRCNCKRPHHRTSPPSLSPETLCNISVTG